MRSRIWTGAPGEVTLAYHEAGLFVIGWCLGLDVRYVLISQDGGASYHKPDSIIPPDAVDHPRLWRLPYRSKAAMVYAGPLSEAHIMGMDLDTYVNVDCFCLSSPGDADDLRTISLLAFGRVNRRW